MTEYLILYVATALIFFPLDFVWLSSTAKGLYRAELGNLLLASPNMMVASLFYLAYLLGVVILVSAPADGDVLKALVTGGVLGLVAYGTYDLTNLATMSGFSAKIAAIDMIWGAALTGISAAGGVWISTAFA